MATAYHERRVLVEIPAPQPKIAGHMRRSYLDVLNSLVRSSPYTSRAPSSKTQRDRPRVGCLSGQRVARCMGQGEYLQGRQMSLTEQDLVRLIRSLFLLEQEKKCVPLCSDLKLLQVDLHLRKARVYRSIPYSRLGSNRDAHCYRKAYPHLLAFKSACQEGGRLLLQSKRWEAALEYTLVAWRYTSKLPQWDTVSHNAVKEQCYGVLAAHCAAALQHGPPGAGKAAELLRRLKAAQTHSPLISPCVQELERILEEPLARLGQTALADDRH
ncbi:hypothetical protein SKAU_G00254600 [Synaphobranchus kaupii]|uniref:Uncharacterized protein n=1 Tax=Synaphobranchus kaupii TaxID=118154 RepID=A0A9Q1IS73_SYNKA|nr:hypothetical protein SKAU_G00254600 [Synaphobranchus kaupii]